MKKLPATILIAASILLLTLFLTGCFSTWSGDTGSIIISLGSKGRSALPWPPSDEELNQNIIHEITISSGEETLSFPAKGGETIKATVAVGLWNVDVKAYYGGELYATGSNSVDVKAGQNNSVVVKMNMVFENTYTVTFDAENGSEPETQIVTEGGTADKPIAPEKDGFYFVHWFDTATEAEWNFDTPITEDLTLKAKWTIYAYTVSFNVDGGSEVEDITEVSHGSVISAPEAPAKANHTFGGWYTDSELTTEYNFANTVTGNITLYAKWNINTYTVTFDSDGGSAVAAITDVNHDSTITEPPTPTKANHTFEGWYDEYSNAIWDFNSNTVTGNIILHAKWTANSAGITLEIWQIEDDTFVFEHSEFDPIIISRSGSNKTFTVTVANDSDYSSIAWEVAGVGAYAEQTVTGSGASFELNAAEVKYNSIGGHVLILTVTKDGLQNIKSIPFKIIQ